jgi:DtxR family Mn-dependent transcriptional regulator
VNTLLIIIIAAAVILLLSWKSLSRRFKNLKQKQERILLEDALKHIYDCISGSQKVTAEKLASYLSVSSEKAATLLKKMESLGLLSKQKDQTVLSEEGKSYALQIVRIHRLWENYLAEKTSTQSSLWHLKAHKAEHNFTAEEANELAAKMGNPLFDPHGDPIPSSKGEVLPKKGKLLTEFENEMSGKIIHIEDEPAEVYSQIEELQLYPGLAVQLIKKENNTLTIKAHGKEILLPALLASNITVEEIEIVEVIDEQLETLASLDTGEEAEVIGIAKTCRGQQRRRLMDLGVVPGSTIRAELKSLGGNPVAYYIRGALIALRNENAEQIFVRKLKKEAA